VTNGKGDGSLVYDYPTMALAALVPALLAEKLERAFVIGWGTGVSAGELASLESVHQVVVAEISPAVVSAAPHFAHGNLDAAQHEKVRIVLGDAYRTLLRSEERYDVILAEPSNPWVLGTEMLFTREFLQASRERLAPGGVHAQWMHLYELDRPALELVLATYREVFDEVSVWHGVGVDLLILGHRKGAGSDELERLIERSERPDFRAALARSGITGTAGLLAHELWPRGVLAELELESELHTLLHPRLSYMAARAFFSGRQTRLPPSLHDAAARVGAERSLVQRYLRRAGRPFSDDEFSELVGETCRHRGAECVTALAWWQREMVTSPRRDALVASIHRDRLGERSTPVRLELVEPVAALFSADPPVANGRDPLLHAKRTTDLFYAYYHHAAPFERGHLDEVWRRCAAEPARREECAKARALAESHLGPLARDPERAADSVPGQARRPLPVD
jgi:hypothetical protein